MASSGSTILLVDDDPINRELLEARLSFTGYRVLSATNGAEALECASSEHPDLILMDIMMPGMSGYDVCRSLKQDPATERIPVIFISAKTNVTDKVAGLQMGATDFISKPFVAEELLARVEVALRTKQEQDRLREEAGRLQAMTLTDPLTGLYNRRMLDERLEEEVSRSRRYGTPLSCLMIDIDDFKKVNDRFGHPTGDTVLKQISEVLRCCSRAIDVVSRYGGEEFAVLLPETCLQGATQAAERIRAQLTHDVGAGVLPGISRVTLSVGIARLSAGDDGNTLLAKADAALYRAKADGKDRIVRDESA
ncbi:MAG TPA: diguanylate cyclase [Armatimonadota bacterium]|jgi:diguanylate cyclase (GGDEF)-like protein